MRRNFRVDNSCEIIKDGVCYDVHNTYSLLSFDWAASSFRISFGRDSHAEFTLVASKVDFLALVMDPLWEEGLVEEIGFKAPDEQNLDWLDAEANAGPRDHIVIRLSEDGYIRIHCESLNISVVE